MLRNTFKRCVGVVVFLVLIVCIAQSSQAAVWQEKYYDFKEELLSDLPITLIDTEYSKDLLNLQNNITEKPLRILQSAQEGRLKDNDFIVSSAFWGSYIFEQSNVPGKFPILSRFPSQHGSTLKESEEWIWNNYAFGFTARFADWITGYGQYEFTELEFPSQNKWQWRKAYVMLGNLDKFPFYAYYGRNTVDFGWLEAYNPMTHTVANHFFRTDSDGPVIGMGYYKNGLHISTTAISSGRHLRTADSKDDTGWDNGAFMISYQKDLNDDLSYKIGAGYLHSTIYDRDIAHHPGTDLSSSVKFQRNSAWDTFLEIQWKKVRVGGEFITTTTDWPATLHPVQAITGQVAYDTSIFDIPTTLSAVYGFGRQGPDSTNYEKLTQMVFGIEMTPIDSMAVSFEYVRNEDFVPLTNITVVSDNDVSTNTFIFGIKIWF